MKLKTKVSVSKTTLIAVGIAVLGLIIGLVGYMAAVSPEKGKIVVVNSQIQVARTSLITAEQAPAKVKALPAKASDLFRLSLAMPDADDLPGVLIAMGQLAKSSSVQLQTVTPALDVPNSGFTSIPLTVTVNATYGTLLRFVSALRNSATVNGDTIHVRGRLFVPTAVSVTTGVGSKITATVSVDAFSYLAPAPAAPAATDGSTTTPAPTTAPPTTST